MRIRPCNADLQRPICGLLSDPAHAGFGAIQVGMTASLVFADVALRVLDVQCFTHVIMYGLPPDVDTCVHCIGFILSEHAEFAD